MKDIVSLIAEAKSPNVTQKHKAFGELISRFQDMVYGYAYAILGDFHLAEDAAQEAFITAYRNLRKLRDAEAFPVWLKRITMTQCNRMTRRKSLPTEPLDTALDISTAHAEPDKIMLEKEISDSVLMAVQALPEKERMVTTLFYINGYSQNEVADFLEVSVGAVNSRLHRSRGKLKERMIAMVQENLHEKRPSRNEKFVSKVLDGVPRVSFRRPDGGHEFTTFAACLRTCLEYLGEDYSYGYIMATAGTAFRMVWAPRAWDGGNIDILGMVEDTMEPIRRALKAVGYGHEIIVKSQIKADEKGSWAAKRIRDSAIGVDGRAEDKAGFQRCVMGNIHNGKPVLAFGVIGPPECCIITGYDDDGETLTGWNFFQDKSEAYFRKSDWYDETYGLILIGEKQQILPLSEIHRSSLEWALKVMRTPRIRDHNGGPDAYTAWAEDMTRDEEFPADDMDILRHRLMCHYDAYCMLAEQNYAVDFLRQVAEHEPAMAEDLEKAAKCISEGRSVDLHKAAGGFINRDNDKALKRLADPAARRRIADLLLTARDKYIEAADHIGQALAR